MSRPLLNNIYTGGGRMVGKRDLLPLALVLVGGLNWGLVAVAKVDLVAWVFGLDFREANAATRIVYGLAGPPPAAARTARERPLRQRPADLPNDRKEVMKKIALLLVLVVAALAAAPL